MGRLGGVDCSVTFSPAASFKAGSVPPSSSLAFADVRLSPSLVARGLGAGEAAGEGASAAP